ncbi:MAG: nucleotide exchange factor GrpE [Clostridia bacterium]|nr:nucleotide exchange factor GrpE [Clostridia bacterium]
MEENKNAKDEELFTNEPELITKKRAKTKTEEAKDEPNEKEEISELDKLKKKVAELEEEIKIRDDKYLRMAAEYDNFRRRSREERDAVYGTAMADTVSELLPIIDNLERAAGFDGDKVAEGLKMISASVAAVFEKLGVEAFGAPGDTFDPNLHNAVMHEENEEKNEGEITEVYQKGYKKGNRIIRFAMVKSAN